jgi:phosphohistidine phosphatase
LIIYFVRHASAGPKKSTELQDRRRPLDPEGILQCTTMGRCLSTLEAHVDIILSSPLKRATQTASLIANEIGHDGTLLTDAALEPQAQFDAFRRMLQKYSRMEAIMVVGHNPSLSQFLSLLISDQQSESAIDLKKGAVARVDLAGRRPASLAWCVTPKIVRAVYESTGTSSRPKTSRK